MDNIQELESKTTSGVFVHWIERHAAFIAQSSDLQRACFHYGVAQELHHLAGQLHSLKRMRPRGMEKVETAFAELTSTWEAFARREMEKSGQDSSNHESYKAYLNHMGMVCWDWWGDF